MKTLIVFIISLLMLVDFGHFIASAITHELTLFSLFIHIFLFILMGLINFCIIVDDAYNKAERYDY